MLSVAWLVNNLAATALWRLVKFDTETMFDLCWVPVLSGLGMSLENGLYT